MSVFSKTSTSCLLLFMAWSCIGIDLQQDPTVDPIIQLGDEQIGLFLGNQIQLAPKYYDEYGLEQSVSFTFSSSNPEVVTINAAGLVTGKAVGSAIIAVRFGEKAMNNLQVNVVSNPEEVAVVKISTNRSTLFPEQQTQMEISIQNVAGQELQGKTIEWFSENEVIASVDQNGLVTGAKFGKTDIHAKVAGVKSNPITVSVAVQQVAGTFVPAGGYRAKGMAFINDEDGKLILRLSEDFETSFALGTFIYLSNSTNGQEIRATGLEVAEIRTNGAHIFGLSARFSNLKITDYSHVIIFCKPAAVTFGFAEMKN